MDGRFESPEGRFVQDEDYKLAQCSWDQELQSPCSYCVSPTGATIEPF